MNLFELTERIPLKSVVLRVAAVSLLIALAVYSLYALVLVFILRISFEAHPVLKVLGCSLALVASMVFSLMFQKKTGLWNDERFQWIRASSNFWTSYITLFVLITWIFYDYGFRGLIRWDLISICILMGLIESVAWIIYSIRK